MKTETTVGQLFIVPTPIGNMEDISFRALRVLKETDLVLAEDTRTTSILFKKYAIHTPMESYHKFNESRQTDRVVARIAQGLRVALVSDAGTPGISDPGFLLVRACHQAEIKVTCLPGATAFVPALVNSGLPADRFCFEGFLPVKKGRRARMEQLAAEERTVIFYESPYRLVKTLAQFLELAGAGREVCISRELSKIFEENRCGTLGEMLQWYQSHEPKGEFVVVMKGRGRSAGKMD